MPLRYGDEQTALVSHFVRHAIVRSLYCLTGFDSIHDCFCRNATNMICWARARAVRHYSITCALENFRSAAPISVYPELDSRAVLRQ